MLKTIHIRVNKILFFILLYFTPISLACAADNFSVVYEKIHSPLIDCIECVFLTAGKYYIEHEEVSALSEKYKFIDGWVGKKYRIIISRNEIYYNLCFEKLIHDDRKRPREYIDFFSCLSSKSLSQLNNNNEESLNLEFIRWKHWDCFVLSINKIIHTVHINERSININQSNICRGDK